MARRRRDRRRAAGLPFTIIATMVRPILLVFTRHTWRGTERIPPPGTGVLFVANHISHVDPFTFAHFLWDNDRAVRFLAKESLFRIPLAGKFIAAARQIPVFRDSRDASQAYRAAVEAVSKGECVVIYPEGTITKDPDLWPMVGKTGAARVALQTGCPIIPVAQWGPNQVLAPYSKKPSLLPPKMIHVSAGPPVDLDDLGARPLSADVLHEATDRIMDAITAQLAEIRGELAPATRFDPKAAGLPSTGDPHSAPERSPEPERAPDGEATP